MITCPNCGELEINDITIYNEYLRKQDFSMLPVLPTCRRCGEEVAITHKCTGGTVIVLNGTCGSGKSTIAEILLTKGFLVIDGDCVIQVVKHKKGKPEWNFKELADEIAREIDILSMFGDNFVVSAVILPEDLDKYMNIFQSRHLKYRLFLLKPEYQTAWERCQTRTCHESITPEYWIQYFYETLNFDDRFIVVDNTHLTAEETASRVLEDK
ncbi:MAG: dephospho-CoA kinase [Fibrobacter sp.]|nr:dephospho-CoA kinase [Fibrobacter sp.]